MNNLYQRKAKLFPATIDIAGNEYDTNADFRNILRIFAVLSDRDISQYKRITKAVQWFFADEPPDNVDINEIFRSFTDFISCKKETTEEMREAENESENEKQYDYDFDAEEIYASFIAEYGIDLVDVDFLHWHKFKILLANLSSESAFKKKIDLRFMDISHFKGQALADIARAKEAVQLPVEYTEEELREIDEFEGLWGRV